MTYKEKLEFLDEHVRMPGTNVEGEDLMRLISLICHLTIDYRAKYKKEKKDYKAITPMIILTNACGKAEPGYAQHIYESIALHCDLVISHDAKFDTYGATSAKAMMEEIKRTVDEWLPF
jgi:hypothetical protein